MTNSPPDSRFDSVNDSLPDSLPSRAPADQGAGSMDQGSMDQGLTHPIHPTQLNAGSIAPTVDGRQADNDLGQRPACTHITELETTTIDDQANGIRTFICRCGRRGESILTIEPTTEPIDRDEPPTPLAAGGIIDTPNLGIELDKPEALFAVSGRVVGSMHQGEKLDVEALRELAAAATVGPWFAEHARPHSGGQIFVGNRADGRAHGLWAIVHASGDRLEDLTEDARRRTIADAEFIAAANPATVSALVDEVLSLRSVVAVARDQALHEAILAVHNSRFYNGQPDCNYNGVRNAERVLREEMGARLDYPDHTCAPVPGWVRS